MHSVVRLTVLNCRPYSCCVSDSTALEEEAAPLQKAEGRYKHGQGALLRCGKRMSNAEQRHARSPSFQMPCCHIPASASHACDSLRRLPEHNCPPASSQRAPAQGHRVCCANRHAHCHRRLRSTDGVLLLRSVQPKGEQWLRREQWHHQPLLALQQRLHHVQQMCKRLTTVRSGYRADRTHTDMECK